MFGHRITCLRLIIVVAAMLWPASVPVLAADDLSSAQPNRAPRLPLGGAESYTDPIIQQLEQQRNRDPLRYLRDDMTRIVENLSQDQTGSQVQARQQQVVARLDMLIQQLEKACKSGSGSNPNPSRPMTDSRLRSGPGGSGEMHDPKSGAKQWGTLPPKQREQILQSATEGFPAGYESILQSYFQRLAQEQAPDNPANLKAAPATGPTAP